MSTAVHTLGEGREGLCHVVLTGVASDPVAQQMVWSSRCTRRLHQQHVQQMVCRGAQHVAQQMQCEYVLHTTWSTRRIQLVD